jgi:hypothetical protein
MGNSKKKQNLVMLQAYMKKEHDKLKQIRLTNKDKKR